VEEESIDAEVGRARGSQPKIEAEQSSKNKISNFGHKLTLVRLKVSFLQTCTDKVSK
jgi:hypothetical protein